MKSKDSKFVLLPILVIAIGFTVALLANQVIGAWAFVPLAIVYWTSIFLIVKPTKESLAAIFTHRTHQPKYAVLAFVPVLFGIVSFVWGTRYISGVVLILLWIVFALVNPVAEELFWRGYLLDHLRWKPAAKILFSSALFLLSHMMWGVFSITIRSTIMILPLAVMGLVWGYVYHKTKSLKWCIIAHSLVDVMNLSVWVFLNIYIPPVLQ